MRIGILGGSFDPIHEGHLQVADKVRALAGLDEILFMVARQAPHKRKREGSTPYHRYAMTVLATLGREAMRASQLELLRPGPSYTIDTLDQLSLLRPGARLCFIAGSDALAEFHLWKEYTRLLKEYCFIFVERPGCRIEVGNLGWKADRIRRVGKEASLDIQNGVSFLIDIEAPPFSSTAIRACFSAGQTPPAGSLPPLVLRYIQTYQLYEESQKRLNQSLPGHQ